ncbi:Uncharacterized protein dnm_001740 [Desulfonema magnum]|uniref:Uncharacterized protein n=1 Tax=Desulfonema magnum TaxID=45655 RepID=A0A975GK63_9BACT|nr:Uncharacterized protein dnm_001740 [Desulfonema magnum]
MDDAAAMERRKWDIKEDGKIGLEEAVRALRVVAGIQEDISHPDADMGVITVSGTGKDSYEVYDSTGTGEPLGSAKTNEDVPLPPGEYTVFLNKSVQTAVVQAGKKEILEAGIVSVAGTGDDKFYVYDETGTGDSLAYAKVNEEIELFPDTYTLSLNKSRQNITVETGIKAVAVAGLISVSGTGQDTFYIYDDDLSGDSLAYAKTNQDIELLPGSYIASVNNTRETAEVEPGEKTVLTAGLVSVSGNGKDDFYVYDTAGNKLDYADTNKEVEVFSGDYTVAVNETSQQIAVESGEKTVLTAGSISVSGTGTDDFYVYNTEGKQLDYTKTNGEVEVFPGTYVVRVNKTKQTATVQAGEKRTLAAGRLTVLSPGEAPSYFGPSYYVYDSDGNKLDSSSLNGEIELFPGSYRVLLNDTAQNASVQAGEETVLLAGTLSVSSTSANTSFYVYNSDEDELGHASVNSRFYVFPGNYIVSLRTVRQNARVYAGEKTVLEAGTLSVSSISKTGNATFYVYDSAWNKLGYASTNKEVEMFPGTYTLRLNDTEKAAMVQAGKNAVLASGTLTVLRTGTSYYDVYDSDENKLYHTSGEKNIELFPGAYKVIFGDENLSAEVRAGQNTEVSF